MRSGMFEDAEFLGTCESCNAEIFEGNYGYRDESTEELFCCGTCLSKSRGLKVLEHDLEFAVLCDNCREIIFPLIQECYEDAEGEIYCDTMCYCLKNGIEMDRLYK